MYGKVNPFESTMINKTKTKSHSVQSEYYWHDTFHDVLWIHSNYLFPPSPIMLSSLEMMMLLSTTHLILFQSIFPQTEAIPTLRERQEALHVDSYVGFQDRTYHRWAFGVFDQGLGYPAYSWPSRRTPPAIAPIPARGPRVYWPLLRHVPSVKTSLNSWQRKCWSIAGR